MGPEELHARVSQVLADRMAQHNNRDAYELAQAILRLMKEKEDIAVDRQYWMEKANQFETETRALQVQVAKHEDVKEQLTLVCEAWKAAANDNRERALLLEDQYKALQAQHGALQRTAQGVLGLVEWEPLRALRQAVEGR